MTTKRPSHEQIIISMESNDSKNLIKLSGNHVANLNYALKDIKSDTIMDFIYINHCGLIISVNKVATSSNLFVVKNYIKNTTSVDSNNIQSKLYLKMISITLVRELIYPSI